MSADTQNETRARFDAPGDVSVADLATVEGVAQIAAPVVVELDAEHFDTAELSLLAADIGLRRRRGGPDAGWHLEIASTRGERLEAHEPLGAARGQPPQALRDLVVARTRSTPLQRVARLRTYRTRYRLLDAGGAALAEVADDTVTADVPGRAPATWREIEVELTGGDRSLLTAVEHELTARGAVPSAASSPLARALADRILAPPSGSDDGAPSTAGDVVRRYLRDQVAVLIDVDPAVRVDLDDAVHKMRVATRRLRSALATYRRLLDTDVTEPVRAELKWLAGALGAVRDAEVIRGHLLEAVGAEPAELVIGPVRARVERTLDERHDAARRRLLDELTSPRYLRLLAALDHLPDAVAGTRAGKPAGRVLVAEVRRTHRRMRRHLDAALAASGFEADELLHEVRKAAKRVRYAAESASDVLGSKADTLAGRMEEAQETLGRHQDSVVTRAVLEQLARDADAELEPSFTYGRLDACEQRRGDEARAAFLALVDDHWSRQPRWMR